MLEMDRIWHEGTGACPRPCRASLRCPKQSLCSSWETTTQPRSTPALEGAVCCLCHMQRNNTQSQLNLKKARSLPDGGLARCLSGLSSPAAHPCQHRPSCRCQAESAKHEQHGWTELLSSSTRDHVLHKAIQQATYVTIYMVSEVHIPPYQINKRKFLSAVIPMCRVSGV